MSKKPVMVSSSSTKSFNSSQECRDVTSASSLCTVTASIISTHTREVVTIYESWMDVVMSYVGRGKEGEGRRSAKEGRKGSGKGCWISVLVCHPRPTEQSLCLLRGTPPGHYLVPEPANVDSCVRTISMMLQLRDLVKPSVSNGQMTIEAPKVLYFRTIPTTRFKKDPTRREPPSS